VSLIGVPPETPLLVARPLKAKVVRAGALWHMEFPKSRRILPRDRPASALTHSEGTGSFASLPRMEAADAVQTKGLGSTLRSSR
jgi:hypothetical protein